jgi:hypothetical protein
MYVLENFLKRYDDKNLGVLFVKRELAKALELFLTLIVGESSKVTAERGSKRVEAYHLYGLFFFDDVLI